MLDHMTTAGIIINDNNEILIEEHIKTDALTLPGGKIDKGEDSFGTIKRELYEELGISITEYTLIGTNEFKNIEYPAHSGVMTNFKAFYFKISGFSGTIENMEHDKCRALHWMSKRDILECPKITVVLRHYLEHM